MINDGDGVEGTLQRHRATFQNTCRLQYRKTRLQQNFHELQAFKEGHDIFLMCNEDIGSVLRQACVNNADDDAYILARAARIVHKEI